MSGKMQLVAGVVSLFISSLIVINQAIPLQQPDIGDKLTSVVSSTESRLLTDDGDEGLVDSDFEDDDADALLDLVDAKEGGVDSFTHLHEKGGEILVPCFGMWWPIGGVGGGPVYDYVDDYYGDYKKKRRSRKKKKAAKMKRKKS